MDRGAARGRALGAVALAAAAAPHLRHGFAFVAAATTLVALLAASVDRSERRIPNALVAWGAAALLVSVPLAGMVDGRVRAAAVGALAGAACYAGPLLALHLSSPAGVGFGDVKLGAVLGAGLGAGHAVLAALGLVVACAAAIVRRLALRRMRGAEPFAPAMAAGVVCVSALTRPLIEALGFHWMT